MTTIPTSINLQPTPGRATSALLILALLAGALAVRLAYYPGNAYRSLDEPQQIQGGLMLAEGLTPAYKASPAAPVIWTSWIYTMVRSADHLLHPELPERLLDTVSRPNGAVSAALFEAYRDASQLRKVQLIEAIVFGLLAVWGAGKYGVLRGGIIGGLLVGGTVAFAPYFVSASLMTRPHIHAWAFAIWAIYLGASVGNGRRRRLAYIVFGLAIASRIEMVLLAPYLLWETWRGMPKPRIKQAIKSLILSAATTLVFAPWLLTSALTNTRTLLFERYTKILLDWKLPDQSYVTRLLDSTFLIGGLAPALLLTLVALYLGLKWKPTRWRFFWAAIITIGTVAAGFFGFASFRDQEGPLVLTILLLSAYGVGALGDAWWKVCGVIAMLGIALGISILALRTDWRTPVATAEPVSQWIEANIRPNNLIYWDAKTVRTLLPNRGASENIWTDAGGFWRKKWEGFRSFEAGEPPRALSIDMMPKEMTSFRQYYILGGRAALLVSRFDVFPRYGSFVRGGGNDMETHFKQGGGVYVLTTNDPIDEVANPPFKTWKSRGNAPTYLWLSSKTYLRPGSEAATQPTTAPATQP